MTINLRCLNLFFVLIAVNLIYAQEDVITAARQNKFDVVKDMLEKDKSLINSKDDRNCTLLHYAANFGATDMVKWLIDNNVNTDVRDVDDILFTGRQAIDGEAAVWSNLTLGLVTRHGGNSV